MKLASLILIAGLLALPLAVSAQAPVNAPSALVHKGAKRTYQLFDPKMVERPALVIMLHGGGGNAANAVNMSQFNALAAKEGFIVAYPDGSGRMYPNLLTWNAGHCCAYAMEQKVDDVGFISALIDKLVTERKVDPSRVYVTGMSNGAMMSHRLGIELSDKVAGIAPVVGALFGDERPPKGPVPAMIIVGAEDKIVPGKGGPLRVGDETGGRLAARRPSADRPVIAADGAPEYWARSNGCKSKGPSTETPTAVHVKWTECTADADVEYYVVARNGHAWPGGRAGRSAADQPTPNFDASRVIWEFFKAHPKPKG